MSWRPLECAGEPREQGSAQGEAWAAELRAWPRRARGGGPLGQVLARRRARRRRWPALAAELPELAARLEGIAAAARVAPGALLLALERGEAAGGALVVPAAQARGGAPLLALVLDGEASDSAPLVRRSAPRRGLRALELTRAARAGSLAGVNEAGLAALALDVDPSAALPATLWAQRVLERCRSVDEALAFLAPAGPSAGRGLLLADPSGALARVGEGRLEADALLGWGRARAPLARRAPAAPLEAEDLVGLLRDHGPHDRGDAATLCRHGGREAQAATILDPGGRALLAALGRPCEQHFTRVGLEERAPARRTTRPRTRALPVVS